MAIIRANNNTLSSVTALPFATVDWLNYMLQ